MDPADITHRFEYHPPTTDAKRKAHEAVRARCRRLAVALNDLLPEGREKSLAITHLEEAMLWGNAALARSNTDEKPNVAVEFCRGCRVLVGYTHMVACPREGRVTADDT